MWLSGQLDLRLAALGFSALFMQLGALALV
jgi:hypothetical protein